MTLYWLYLEVDDLGKVYDIVLIVFEKQMVWARYMTLYLLYLRNRWSRLGI